eukprot:TRINITY_DN25850_c0_g1_i1.p3 TRINITY_DN25850_c0_g1~~TRINITY_DN25850_c0_g1_i1.p3  ORF type:complete len:104 (-),score=19.65 TRINITY_DN25850_c0_g1_i1:34-345(-)
MQPRSPSNQCVLSELISSLPSSRAAFKPSRLLSRVQATCELTPAPPPRAPAMPSIRFRASAMLAVLARPAGQPEVQENPSASARQEVQQETLEKPAIALKGAQ